MRVLLDYRPTYHRVLLLATGVTLIAGCGHKAVVPPHVRNANTHVKVEAPWKNGGRIPARYTCDGGGIKPQVGAAMPASARDVAIVLTDRDAPGGTFVHWTHWGASSEGKNSFGEVGYGPPCPPKGDKPHHYVLTFYALRRPLGLAGGATPDQVMAAIKKAAFESSSSIGTYSR